MKQNKSMFTYIIDAIALITLAVFLILITYTKKAMIKPISMVKALING